MSYILDALKRADAERERGAVPGLHARQPTNQALPGTRRMPQRVWMAVAALLTLAGLVAAGLWFRPAPDAAVPPAALESATPKPLAPAPLAQPAPALAPLPATAAPPLPPQPAVTASRPASKPATKPAVVARAAPVAAQSTPSPKADPAARDAASPDAPPAVRLLRDFPEDLRRQIPALVITGTVYSKNPEKRLLLVNNQVLSQGSLAAPEVTLEDIQPKSSVFSFRGTRFRVAY